jgi:hypothetical protein
MEAPLTPKTQNIWQETKNVGAPKFSVIHPAALPSCGSQLYKL